MADDYSTLHFHSQVPSLCLTFPHFRGFDITGHTVPTISTIPTTTPVPDAHTHTTLPRSAGSQIPTNSTAGAGPTRSPYYTTPAFT